MQGYSYSCSKARSCWWRYFDQSYQICCALAVSRSLPPFTDLVVVWPSYSMAFWTFGYYALKAGFLFLWWRCWILFLALSLNSFRCCYSLKSSLLHHAGPSGSKITSWTSRPSCSSLQRTWMEQLAEGVHRCFSLRIMLSWRCWDKHFWIYLCWC